MNTIRRLLLLEHFEMVIFAKRPTVLKGCYRRFTNFESHKISPQITDTAVHAKNKFIQAAPKLANWRKSCCNY